MGDFFTVITPSYNSKYLTQTIESVVMQDYPFIEYIVIDDGSESFDEVTVENLIKRNKKISCKIIKHAENQGTVKTLNDAITASSGKYIFELAADDCFYDSSVISRLYEEFESGGHMIITGRRMICTEDDLMDLYVQPSKKIVEIFKSDSNQKLFEKMCDENVVMGCCTAYSRETIDQFGLYDTRYRYIEDYPRYLYLVRSGISVHFMDYILVRYRDGGISSIGKFNEIYEKENDLVMENEVFPFAKNAVCVRRNYNKWKNRRRIGAEMYTALTNSAGLVGKLMCLIKYSTKSPYMVAVYLKSKIHGM